MAVELKTERQPETGPAASLRHYVSFRSQAAEQHQDEDKAKWHSKQP